MQYRIASPDDLPAIILLWQQVFGDDEPLILHWLQAFAGRGNVFVAEETGSIRAQLLAVPCHIKEKQGFYLYALATSPAVRGRGVMSALMAFAERHFIGVGAAFICLVPANPPLFHFYAKRGYTIHTCLAQGRYTCVGSAPANAESAGAILENPTGGIITALELQRLRRKYISVPFVDFDLERYEVILEDFYAQRGRAITSDTGYALFLPMGQELLVPELFADDVMAAEQLLQLVCHKTSFHKIRVAAAPSQQIQASSSWHGAANLPFAMAKPLQEGGQAETLYLRMVLEEFN